MVFAEPAVPLLSPASCPAHSSSRMQYQREPTSRRDRTHKLLSRFFDACFRCCHEVVHIRTFLWHGPGSSALCSCSSGHTGMPKMTNLPDHSSVLVWGASAVLNSKSACIHTDASADEFCAALAHVNSGENRMIALITTARVCLAVTGLFLVGLWTQCFTFLRWGCCGKECPTGCDRACTSCCSALGFGWCAFDLLLSAYLVSIAVPGLAEGAARLW
jgi:hypothetical protein